MLEIGSLIDGKYKILNKIGQGSMGVVYLAMNERANKPWAIKEVRRDGVKDFELVKQGLIVEANILKRLRHPRLPSIVDVIENEDTFLIVMDYIEGNTLEKVLEEYGALPQENVIQWAKQLCDVLGYLHSRNPPIIHRDIKPKNIMLKPDGDIMLFDFGTAREFKEKNVKDTVCLGTIGYAAPEQFGGQGQTDARTDIYGLGATLYHLVTGRSPAEPPYEIRPIREINPTLSSGFERIILKCTQRDPAARYQSCAELMYALEHYEEMDDYYKKGQKKKLFLFFAAAIMTIAFSAVSVFGYVSAEQKLGEDYDMILTESSGANLSAVEKENLLLQAMSVLPGDSRAYLQLIDLFLSGDDSVFTKEEAAVITQIKAGLDQTDGQGISSTIYPLDTLKSQNPEGYAEVSYQIGLAYWYDYEVVSERRSSAVEWFSNAIEKYPIAQTFVDIGECHQDIRKFSGQQRTEDMYSAYGELWGKLNQLFKNTYDIEDNDTKILVWNEIADTISDQAGYFISVTSAEEMQSLLDEIKKEAEDLQSTTKYQDVKRIINELLQKIDLAMNRVESALG